MRERKGSNRPEPDRRRSALVGGVSFIAPSFITCCLALAIVPLISGCRSPAPVDPLSAPLVVAIETGPTLLDPRLASDAYSERIAQLIFNGLVQLDADGKIVPDLAEGWEIENERIYTFRLRRGVRFHDGTGLTSDDVRYTFESLRSPLSASPFRKDFEVIDRIETPDPFTVRFRLRRPHAPFLLDLTRGIVPRHAAESERRDFASRPIGTGPFMLTRWLQDQSIELTANAGYFEGTPHISKVVFRIIPEEGTRLMELLADSVDLLENGLSPDLIDRVRQNPSLVVQSGNGNAYTYLGLNLTHPALGNIRVRKAIAYGINREGIIRDILRGSAQRATGVLPPDHWAYEGDLQTFPYDPVRAKQLLKESGFPLPLRLSYKTSQNELARRIAEAIQQQLSEIGIQVELRSYEWATFYDDIKSGRFQLYTLSWVGVNEPDILFGLFHSESISPAGLNRGRYRNPRTDRWLEEGRSTTDPAMRAKAYRAVQKQIADDLPYVSLWHPKNVVILKRNLKGFILYPGGDLISLKNVRRVRE